MQTNQILSASLNDIIFDGRNKSYGAYELRNTYDRRVKKSMAITITIVSLAIVGTVFGNSSGPKAPTKVVNDGIVITEYQEKAPELPKPEIEQPQPAQASSAPETVVFVEPTIVEDEEFTEGPPTQKDLETAAIGHEKIDGPPDGGSVDLPAMPGNSNGIIDDKIIKDDSPAVIVEIEAKFAGNWENFLRKNLDPQVPVDNDAPPGNHTILIQFVVDVDGSVSDIKSLTAVGYGMEQEAIRVFRKASRWEPAIMNGIKVKAYRRQPITFQVLED